MSNNNVPNKAHSCRVLDDNDRQFIAQNVGTRFIASRAGPGESQSKQKNIWNLKTTTQNYV